MGTPIAAAAFALVRRPLLRLIRNSDDSRKLLQGGQPY
jgi:hypothetical protein